MKRLPAFTLLELLIGMIISSIVIGFGYTAYSLIYKQYLGYKQVKEKVVEMTLLNHLLSADIDNAVLVSYNKNTLSLFKKNDSTLQYHFHDLFILRTENELTDTFKVLPVNIKTDFLLPDQLMFVKQFSFDANVLDEKEHFSYTKCYSSETLMQYSSLSKNQ